MIEFSCRHFDSLALEVSNSPLLFIYLHTWLFFCWMQQRVCVCNVDAPNKWRIDETKKKKRTRRKSLSCSYAHTHWMVDCIYTSILFLSSICLQSLSIVPLLLFLSFSTALPLCDSIVYVSVKWSIVRRKKTNGRSRFAELFVFVSRWVSLRENNHRLGKAVHDQAYPLILDAYVLCSCVISSMMILSILHERLLYSTTTTATTGPMSNTNTRTFFSFFPSPCVCVFYLPGFLRSGFFFLLDTSFLFRPLSMYYVHRFHFH